jgi:hypothetical protein
VTARSTVESRKMDPTGIVAFRQGDVGEYLREVDFFEFELCIILLIADRRILFSLHEHCAPCTNLCSRPRQAFSFAVRVQNSRMVVNTPDELASFDLIGI